MSLDIKLGLIFSMSVYFLCIKATVLCTRLRDYRRRGFAKGYLAICLHKCERIRLLQFKSRMYRNHLGDNNSRISKKSRLLKICPLFIDGKYYCYYGGKVVKYDSESKSLAWYWLERDVTKDVNGKICGGLSIIAV